MAQEVALGLRSRGRDRMALETEPEIKKARKNPRLWGHFTFL